MRPATIAIALVMLVPACWLGAVPPTPPAESPAAAGAPVSPRIHSAKLVAMTELPDGGLVVAATGSGAALDDAVCAPREDHLLVARLSAAGRIPFPFPLPLPLPFPLLLPNG